MKKRIVWRLGDRLTLYNHLVKKFGPLSSWEGRTEPNNKEEFNKFCRGFAHVVGAKSGEAVKQQIRWAITTQNKVGPSHMTTYFGNKLAAMDSGFITKTNLPSNTVCKY